MGSSCIAKIIGIENTIFSLKNQSFFHVIKTYFFLTSMITLNPYHLMA